MPLIIKNYDPEIADTPKETLGFAESLVCVADYVEEITEVIGFRDNPLLEEEPENLYTWGEGEGVWDLAYSWNSFNLTDLEENINNFQYIGFQESASYVLVIVDTETSCWDVIVVAGDAHDHTKVWNSFYEYSSEDLIDVGQPANLIDVFQLQDSIREWVSIIYDEWETTIWDYEKIWDDDSVWIWEGKSTVILASIDDTIGFNDLLTSNQDYCVIPITDIAGFSDEFGFVEVAVHLFEHIGFNSVSTYEPSIYDKDFTEIIGFNDTLVINYVDILNTLLDKLGLQDTLSSQATFLNYLYNDCGFKDEFHINDHILFWRSRTHNYLMAYGGVPYGEFGYGDGQYTDLKEYRILVKNTSTGALIRDVTITITDNTEATPYYVYSWATNVADNGTYLHTLTFDVYEVDIYGNLSEKRTVTAT